MIYLLLGHLDSVEILLREGAEPDLIDLEGKSIWNGSAGEVSQFLSTRFRMSPHHYLKKPDYTIDRSLSLSFYYYIHFGLFLLALHYVGWVTALLVYCFGIFMWLRWGLWPGQDERNPVWADFTVNAFYLMSWSYWFYISPGT